MASRVGKVLCVEDEQDIRENIADILRDEGYEVYEASDGKAGYEAFIENKPDLVISDIMMPEVDGYGFLKMVRENKASRKNNVPFIFLTALGHKENVLKGVSLSANDYLVKPIDFDLLIAKVKEKTENSIKVEEAHNSNINNLKNQVSSILPSDLMSHISILTQVAENLKREPYGPLPHRNYLRDFEKVYSTTLKIKSSIINALDEKVINYKLNANEELFNLNGFLKHFISNLSKKYSDRIYIDQVDEDLLTAKVKFDHFVLIEALKKILSSFLKIDDNSKVKISMMIDHLDQLVLIFGLESDTREINVSDHINESQISKILDKQNCTFEFAQSAEGTAVLVIPPYRVVK